MDQATRASTPSRTTSMHRVRHTVVEAKQRQLSPDHRLPDRLVRWIPQSSSLSLSFLSLSVRIDLPIGEPEARPRSRGEGGELERRNWVETSNQIQDKDAPLGGGERRDSSSARRGNFPAT